ncbi:nucleotidyltransferase-like protein [Bacillus testis]|uniref:nucleotidyltransferase-like protein n=1 Tax=Bacillus testis TaxID=1622072 RepID=UPI00067EF02B|nr:nucleotidyltransferase-like protein [Bacillus testis]
MEDILRPIYQERASSASTLGILLVEKKNIVTDITDSFDYVLIVITNKEEPELNIKHYSYQDKKAALYVVGMKQVQEWLLLGSNRRLIEWLHNGKIIYDRNENISQLKKEIMDFPFQGRKLKKGLEFAKLIRRYTDGKVFFDSEHYMDAYNNIIHSLHHLARLAVIESGFYPEVTVWDQVKHIEPQIYKLYEELITSEEGLDKRLELLFLASEFLIYSRTETGTQHLMDILSSREEPWTINELVNEKELKYYSVDLAPLIEYMIEKDLIEEVLIETKGNEIYHRLYKIK